MVRRRFSIHLTLLAFLFVVFSRIECSSSSSGSSSKNEETKSANDFSLGRLKDDIFIDDAQADAVEGSAVTGEFSDLDEESSGMGPDDEDAFEGSGEGSGAGSFVKETNVYPIPATPPKKPLPAIPKAEVPRKMDVGATPKKPTASKPSLPSSTSETPQVRSETTPVPYVPVPPDFNAIPETPPRVPDRTSPSKPTSDIDNDDQNEKRNDISIMGRQSDDGDNSFFSQPGILAAVIGGAVVGLLCAILLVMFIVYRMRKKDEGKEPPNHRGYEPGKPFDWKSQGKQNWPLREKC